MQARSTSPTNESLFSCTAGPNRSHGRTAVMAHARKLAKRRQRRRYPAGIPGTSCPTAQNPQRAHAGWPEGGVGSSAAGREPCYLLNSKL